MKKVLIILIVVVLLICIPENPHAAAEESMTFLSELTDADLISFLEEYEISIPGGETNFEYWEEFIRRYLEYVEDRVDVVPIYNWTVAAGFSNALMDAAEEYYAIPAIYVVSNIPSSNRLIHSTVIGTWKPVYELYNCYSYATNHIDSIYDPGEVSGYSYSVLPSLLQLCEYVERDLEYWGYECVTRTLIEPNRETVDPEEQVCCLRIGDGDYHFMKLSGNIWTHKPSITNPLQWNYASPGAEDWSNECSYKNQIYQGYLYYSSDIYYFRSRLEHSVNKIYTGEHYHSGIKHYYKIQHKCIYCGDVEDSYWETVICDGPPCALEYTSLAPNESLVS